MDQQTYQQCLHHLEEAEKCMMEPVDGYHRARLSLVVELLREAYGPHLWPPQPPPASTQ